MCFLAYHRRCVGGLGLSVACRMRACVWLLCHHRCVGGLGLSVVCRMLSEDFSGWRGGMPDLLLWRPAALEAKLSEVKGPRDRLSDAQRAWIAALSDVGMRCEVLRVQEPS